MRTPDLDAVAAPGVHVAAGVDLEAVGDALRGARKEAAVAQGGGVGGVQVERVAVGRVSYVWSGWR